MPKDIYCKSLETVSTPVSYFCSIKIQAACFGNSIVPKKDVAETATSQTSMGFVVGHRKNFRSHFPQDALPQCWSPNLRHTTRKRVLSSSLMSRTRSVEIPSTSQNRKKNKAFFTSRSKTYNILVLGAKSVGKSALTVRYLTRRFIGEYMSGEDQTYDHVAVNVKHQPNVVFLDTSHKMDGKENADELVLDEKQLAWADGVIVVYDVSNASTFKFAANIINRIHGGQTDRSSGGEPPSSKGRLSVESLVRRQHTNHTRKPTLLVGNKTDLKRRRCVSESEARNSSTSAFETWLEWHELSAVDGYDEVSQRVDDLILKIHKAKK